MICSGNGEASGRTAQELVNYGMNEMDAPYDIEIDRDHQLELIELLDERLRLRDDPRRRSELERAHARLREKLHDTSASVTSMRPGGRDPRLYPATGPEARR